MVVVVLLTSLALQYFRPPVRTPRVKLLGFLHFMRVTKYLGETRNARLLASVIRRLNAKKNIYRGQKDVIPFSLFFFPSSGYSPILR